MSISKNIVWEKWRDPLGYDDLEDKLSENNIDDEEEEKPSVQVRNIKEQFALTPLGMIPLTENTVSSKIFNFWTGHTTFPISKKIADIIENIDGVETLDIFTRYRFRVSVGKAFDDSVVLRSINSGINNYFSEKNNNDT